MSRLLYLIGMVVVLLSSCQESIKEISTTEESSIDSEGISVWVLGNIQDAGSPHIGCKKDCCVHLFEQPDPRRKVVSLGIVDADQHKSYLLEATPDMPKQLEMLSHHSTQSPLNGIFLTHAHIGHYTGLMYLGKEAVNASKTPVYAMPRMKAFLDSNGPWDQLVRDSNIVIEELQGDSTLSFGPILKITPFRVPHRDEYSETVGYVVTGTSRSLLFIPDIDKWDRWERNILEEISKVDYALVDGTFYDADEIGHRDISQIPHPFITESLELFQELSPSDKEKVYFIHFNHTNPVIDEQSEQSLEVERRGFKLARPGQEFKL